MKTEMARAGSDPRSRWRSFVAVLLGFVAVVILSLGTDVIMHVTRVFPPWGQPMPDGLFVLATAYRVIYTVAGGYITARLAPSQPMKHAIILGAIGFVAAVAGALATWKQLPGLGPKWYPIALIVTSLPCTWLGGRLASSQQRERVVGAS
jgi:hypothetical protein